MGLDGEKSLMVLIFSKFNKLKFIEFKIKFGATYA
jgi:hypothetical protein